MRDLIRSLIPQFLLKKYRAYKKQNQRKLLEKDQKEGKIITLDKLEKDLKAAGIKKGDILVVHSALSKIGFVDGGAETVIQALINSVGDTGHILMPTSPNHSFQLDYIQQNKVFDVLNSPSAMGKITEVFRTKFDTVRSCNPTEPFSCWGHNKNWFVEGHFGKKTPYQPDSPLGKVAQSGGKVIFIGVTLNNAGTILHLLEDAVEDFKFPVYYHKEFEYTIITSDGVEHHFKTKVHNPVFSKKRKCDELIPMFEREGVLHRAKVGNADSLVVDAQGLLRVMLEQYYQNGVTMYTPQGS